MSKEIPLCGGQIAIVDDDDCDWICQYSWHLGGTGRKYATTNIFLNGRYVSKSMHRLIMQRKLGRELTEHEVVHHRHEVPLDNRKSELQLFESWPAHSREHNRKKVNRKKPPYLQRGCSGYYGVRWSQVAKKWQAFIFKNHIRTKLGNFIDLEEAALMYDKSAREIYGDRAILNFPNWP